MGGTCQSKAAAEEGVEHLPVPTASAAKAKEQQDNEERRTDSETKAMLDKHRSKSFWSGLDLDGHSDEHSLEWLNAIIQLVYPRFNKAMQADVLPMVQQEVTSKAQALSGVSAITITSFDFGETPPVVGPLDVSRRSVLTGSGQAIEIRWKMQWESNCNINMKVSTRVKEFTMGLTKLRLFGEVTVLLCPIINVLPCVAAVQVYMVSPPLLDFELQGTFRSMGEGMAQILQGFVRNGVLKAFQQQIVEPNRMMILSPVVKLFQGKLEMNASNKVDDPTSLKHPRPEILAEIGAIEAQGLTAKDWSMRGGSSDPFAVIRLGDRDFRTKTVRKNVNPTWGEEGFGDFLVFSMRQQVHVEVLDNDTLQDDLIGRLPPLTFADLAKRRQEEWYDIFEADPGKLASGIGQGDAEGTVTGKVKLGYTLFAFSSDPETVKKPPKKKTRGTSFMQVQIKCLRGLPEELARGARVNVKVEGESKYTKGSKYVASRNRSDADATSQRLAEHLILVEKEDPETVAKVAGLDLETVHAILRHKPSFTCRWFEGLDIVLQDALTAVVEIEVELKGGRTLKAQQQLAVADLLQAVDMTFETSMRLEDATDSAYQSRVMLGRRRSARRADSAGAGRADTAGAVQEEKSEETEGSRSSSIFGRLSKARASVMDTIFHYEQGAEHEHEPEVFDLDIMFSLYGLTPYKRGQLEPPSRGVPDTSPPPLAS